MGPELSMIEAHELEAAAAEIAHHPVRPGNAGDDAEGGEFRLFGSRKDTHGRAAAPAHGGSEFGSILGVAHSRRRQQIETLSAHRLGQAHEAVQIDERRINARFVQASGFIQAAAQPAEHLLVEQQQGRAGDSVEDDKADGVGADVNDGDAAPMRTRLRLAAGPRSSHPCHAFFRSSWGAFLDFLSALPRPERLGLVMK